MRRFYIFVLQDHGRLEAWLEHAQSTQPGAQGWVATPASWRRSQVAWHRRAKDESRAGRGVFHIMYRTYRWGGPLIFLGSLDTPWHLILLGNFDTSWLTWMLSLTDLFDN